MSIKDLEKIWDEFDNNYKDEEKINPSVLQGTNDLEWEYINVCKNCFVFVIVEFVNNFSSFQWIFRKIHFVIRGLTLFR